MKNEIMSFSSPSNDTLALAPSTQLSREEIERRLNKISLRQKLARQLSPSTFMNYREQWILFSAEQYLFKEVNLKAYYQTFIELLSPIIAACFCLKSGFISSEAFTKGAKRGEKCIFGFKFGTTLVALAGSAAGSEITSATAEHILQNYEVHVAKYLADWVPLGHINYIEHLVRKLAVLYTVSQKSKLISGTTLQNTFAHPHHHELWEKLKSHFTFTESQSEELIVRQAYFDVKNFVDRVFCRELKAENYGLDSGPEFKLEMLDDCLEEIFSAEALSNYIDFVSQQALPDMPSYLESQDTSTVDANLVPLSAPAQSDSHRAHVAPMPEATSAGCFSWLSCMRRPMVHPERANTPSA